MSVLTPVPEGSKVEPLGSAILLIHEDSHNLISAGHLINIDDYNNLIMPLPGTQEGLFIDTFGDLKTTNKKGEQKDNEIDFAKIEFKRKDKVEKVSQFYTFIQQEQIELDHVPKADDDRYFIFGYPNSRAKFDYKNKKEINSEPLRIVTYPIVDEEFYIKNGFSSDTHLLLHIQRKLQVNGNRVFKPKTKGLSGCGVYFLPELKSEEESGDFKLLGILTEVDFEKQFATVVRMNTILNRINAS